MRITSLLFIIALLLLIAACNSKPSGTTDISTDSVTIEKGRVAFIQNCSSCHNFRQDGIGPQLSGITTVVSQEWIKNFIRNPKAQIESGDERSKNLFARYKTMMPAFGHYTDEELDAIVAYLHTEQGQAAPETNETGLKELKNPIVEPIQSSDLVVGVELVTQVPASSKEGIKTRIAKLDYIPGTDRRFIVDIRGKLYELRNDKPEVYMDLAAMKPDFIDAPGLATGFGSFAFHPEFLKNGLLYTSHTEPPGSAKADFHYVDSIPVTVQWVITEWRAEQPGSFPFRGKGRELFRIDMVTGMHGVQELAFNPTAGPNDKDYGLLHIGIGDGASVQSGYPFLVQNIEKPWGSIFRIDPSGNNSANGNYGIPRSNPFVSKENSQALGEIYAYGFRNPHRITWTTAGQMLASNIGQAQIESVNLILPGHNYGWPIREGTFLVNPYGDINVVYPLPENDAAYGITYPAAQYDHDEGLAVSGGFEYTASELPELKGKYLFADMNNGRLYYINLAEVAPGKQAVIREWKITLNGRPTTTAELCGSQRVDLRLGKDHNGNVYFFSKQDGKVYRLVPPRANLSMR